MLAHTRLILQALCISILAQMPLWAAQPLQISPAELTITPAIEDTSGIYIFRVANNSQLSQTIAEFKGGCSCVGHGLKVTELAPGASTDLTVTLDFEDSVGPLKRKIALMTNSKDDKEPVRNEVVISGVIPTPLTFSQKSAIWMYGDEPIPKTVTVVVQPDVELHDLKVENPTVNPFITLTTAPSMDGRGLVITVQPTSTDIAVVSPSERATVHVGYIVSYAFPSGKRRYEKLWILLAKRPK